MITKVRVVRFKRFADHVFDVSGSPILLAGPNNSGKTTLLHALAAWNLALTRWIAERGGEGGKKRIGVVLDEFTALPLREMNLLWLNRHTARRTTGQRQPKPAPIYIEVTVSHGQYAHESLTIEFMYANEKLVYVRPVKGPDDPDALGTLPEFAHRRNVVHVPAFSGIGTHEPRHGVGIQNKLVGEGRPGEIVRNLMVDLWQASIPAAGEPPAEDCEPWSGLCGDIERLFQCELLPPEFSDARPYIVCEYRPKPNRRENSGRSPKLDIANAGSGFHQVLLLLAFFYGKPSSVLLLDEPDAHLHFILQREIFDHLQSVARNRACQLIVATHAEVLLDSSEPEQIISFVGQEPRRLVGPEEKQRLRDALRRLGSIDLLQADQVGAVLYVEDESDYKILREWSRLLTHPASEFLDFPFVVRLGGVGGLDDAKKHFQSLRLAKPGIKGICILDRDDRSSVDASTAPVGLELRRWKRYEIENYLLVPGALERFLGRGDSLFEMSQTDRDRNAIATEFAANFPLNVDFMGDVPALRDLKASEFLVGLFGKTSVQVKKRDLYEVAAKLLPSEIHADVREMLDAIGAIRPTTVPTIAINQSPLDTNGISDTEESR